MEEIFETLRKQIKGGFDQNNIIIILDNSISLTCKKHPIPGTNNSIIIIQPYLIDTLENIGKQSLNIFEYFHRVQIYLDILIQVQWIKMSLNLKCYFIRQFIQQKLFELNKYRELPKQRRKFPIIILNPNNLRTKGLQNTTQPQT